ncbi:MAG: SurA N-terminal domain-containing protein [Bacteroidales bacterium]
MATLEKIRNRAGILISVVIGLALLAFILGDLFSQGGMAFQQNQNVIAEVKGKEIPYQMFQQEVDKLIEINKFSQGESSLDNEKREEIREQVWEMLTRDYVMQDVYEDLGINVSSEELWDMVQGENVHPMIQRIFSDPETGEVNTMAIIQFLKSYDQDPSGQRKAYWLFLEEQMTKERKFNKFNTLVAQGINVTSSKSERLAELNSKNIDLQYVMHPYNEVEDNDVDIDESELKDYYNKHKENYKQSSSRDIEYVTFNIEPTEEDINEILRWIEDMKSDYQETERDEEFINLNSDISFDRTYYKKEELSDSIADFIFNADIGDIYGPYLENETYKLAKLIDKKQLPDSIKLRHVMIQPTRSQAGVQEARNRADSLAQVLKEGADFANIAQQYSDDQSTAGEGGNLGWLSKNDYSEAVLDTAFLSDVGEIKIVQGQEGFHLIEVVEKGRLTSKVQVGILARNLEPSSKTYQQVYSKASKFAGENNTYDEFISSIEEKDITKRVASNVQIDAKQIPGLSDARPLIRSAFDTKKEEMIKSENDPVFEIDDKFVIAFVTDVRKEGYAEFERVRDDIESKVREQKKADKIIEDISDDLKNINSLQNYAQNASIELQQANNINYNSYQLRGAGSEPRVVSASVSLEPNTISTPIKGNNGVFLVEVIDLEETTQSSERIRKEQLQRLQELATEEAYEALKEAADIKDRRYRFY